MCLLALFYRVVPGTPVVVGANREELYARGGEPPRLVNGRPRFVAGLDSVAGGTWLGVNEYGVLVALTNRRKSDRPARPRSRGLLARDLLGCPSAAAAGRQAVRALDGNSYAGCNVLCVDSRDAIIVLAGDWLRVRPLPTGLHVLANGDVNDHGDRRVGHALNWLGRCSIQSAEDCLAALAELCGQTSPADAPMCFRLSDRGTVSSTLVALSVPPSGSSYRHAQGSPDRTPYEDYSALLRSTGGIDSP